MNRIVGLAFFLLSCATILSAQNTIGGIVIDKDTKEPMAFAAIGFMGTTVGTVSNSDGYFEMNLPDGYKNLQLQVSFLGYETVLINSTEFGGKMRVAMTSSFVELSELVIRPLSPQDYIRRAVRSIPSNYSDAPFETEAYYREKITENGGFIALNEAYLKSFYPDYLDTVKNQHKVLLYRTAENIQEVQFMKQWTDKQKAKEERKQEKKAQKNKSKEVEIKEEKVQKDTVNTTEAGFFAANFGGLDQVFQSDLVKRLEDFLDSTRFKKYRYEFANGIKYLDRELLVIKFQSKGKVEHAKTEGHIYIDIMSDAIVAVDYLAEAFIPIAIRPLLFAFGISVDDIKYRKQLRYTQMKDTWYLKSMKIDIGAYIEKRHIFGTNEKSLFAVDQVFNVNKLSIENIKEIPEDYRYTSKKSIKTQVFNETGLDWEDVNTVVLEEL
ncbi:MAG: carboxypeptidase-like regulatory domain-containing protein [Cyclobacteriaceae bacterium]